jgi:hypothetical protein
MEDEVPRSSDESRPNEEETEEIRDFMKMDEVAKAKAKAVLLEEIEGVEEEEDEEEEEEEDGEEEDGEEGGEGEEGGGGEEGGMEKETRICIPDWLQKPLSAFQKELRRRFFVEGGNQETNPQRPKEGQSNEGMNAGPPVEVLHTHSL